MFLQVTGSFGSYDIHLTNLLNLVIGESSTGKTNLITMLRRKDTKCNTNFSSIELLQDARLLPVLASNSLVVIDMDEFEDSSLFDAIAKCKRNDVYFLLMGRKYRKRLPIAVESTFVFRTIKGVTSNHKFVENELYNAANFKIVKVEDSKSGFYFFDKVFNNVESLGSNSKVINSINEDTLVIFDAAGFGGYIEDFCKKVKSNTEYAYLGYQSFEFFILDEIFKDTSIPSTINMEEGYTEKLRACIQGYSKSNGCTGDACKVCSNTCKQSSIRVFRKSKYKELLNYEDCEDVFLSGSDFMSNV